jgi:hypothetical protein
MLPFALIACSSSTRTYRETWQPVAVERVGEHPRLVVAALLVRNGDLPTLQAAGAELIGWHEAPKGWAVRVGSTGGTHFYPVEQTNATGRTSCYAWSGLMMCESSQTAGRWTRVAVLRLDASRWHLLPRT